MKLKLLNSIVAVLQDANPKIVIAGLGCIEVIVEKHFEHYQPLVNMSFDVLLLKLGDARVSCHITIPFFLMLPQASVRSSATSVMLRLIQAIGLSAGFERLSVRIMMSFHVFELTSQKHIQHKNHIQVYLSNPP